MSRAVVQELAEAVKETLNAASGSFSIPFTAVRAYKPQFQRDELSSLRVSVIGRKTTSELLTRGGLQQTDYQVDVLVQKALSDPTSNTEADDLSGLVEEIRNYFFTHPVTGRDEELTGIDTDLFGQADYSGAQYLTQRAFSSGCTLTFRGPQ